MQEIESGYDHGYMGSFHTKGVYSSYANILSIIAIGKERWEG